MVADKLSASSSNLIHRKRVREKRIFIRHLKRSVSRQLIAEPFITPFHHLNLVFAELKVPLVKKEEAHQVVQEIVVRYGSLVQSQVWANSGETSNSSDSPKKSVNKRKKQFKSILDASQTSMSQYEEHDQALQRSALLLDAIELLCGERGLLVDRHTVKKADDFATLPVLPQKSVLLYVDKENPFFLSVFAFFENEIKRRHPLLFGERRNVKEKKEQAQYQIICSSPYPVQWRTIAPQCLRLVNQHCAIATIYKADRNSHVIGERLTDRSMRPNSLLSAVMVPNSPASLTLIPEREDEAAQKKEMCGSRKRGNDNLSNSDENDEEFRYLIRSVSPSDSSEDFVLEEDSRDCVSRRDQCFSSENHHSSLLYSTCPFGIEPLFSKESTIEDPFLDLPKGYLPRKPKREWHASAFRKCKGNNVKRRLLMDQAHRMTEHEEDWYNFS